MDFQDLLEEMAEQIQDMLALIRSGRIGYADDLEDELQDMLNKIEDVLGV